MHEVTDRLESLGRRQALIPEQTIIDADVRRGRAALNRRRRRQGAAATAAVAALAIAGVSLSAAAPTRSRVSTQAGTRLPSVHLVAYTGAQPAGFTVAKIPAGYVLQGAQPTTLDIAEPGNHTSLDSFVDKLVVSLQSTDATTPTAGTRVKVNGEPGVITVSDGVHTLTYSEGNHEVQVQAWSNIHLTDSQLVTFAAGVTVTSAVQPTHG
jgi:hypothetical protein